VTSPTGLWTTVLFGCHLGFLESQVTIFGHEGGAVEERGVDLTENLRTPLW